MTASTVNAPRASFSKSKLIRFSLLALLLCIIGLEGASRLADSRPCSSAALQDEYLARVGSHKPQTLNESLGRSTPMPYDPYLLWHLVANFQGENLGVEVVHNSRGFRSPEIPVKKGKGTARVLLLGDSTIYGHGVKEEDVLRIRLEALLRSQWTGKTIDVINGGVPGYSSLQSLNLYRRFGGEYSPDIVVIANLWSDCVRDRFEDKKVIYGEGSAALGSRALQTLEETLAPRSALYCHLRRLVWRLRPKTCQGLPPLCAPPPDQLAPEGKKPGDTKSASSPGSRDVQPVRQPGSDGPEGVGSGFKGPRVAPEDYRANLRQLIKTVREDDAVPVMVALASGVDLHEMTDEAGALGDYLTYRQIFREVATEADAPLVDMVEAFKNATQGGPYFMDRVHPTAVGHQVMANALFVGLKNDALCIRKLEP